MRYSDASYRKGARGGEAARRPGFQWPLDRKGRAPLKAWYPPGYKSPGRKAAEAFGRGALRRTPYLGWLLLAYGLWELAGVFVKPRGLYLPPGGDWTIVCDLGAPQWLNGQCSGACGQGPLNILLNGTGEAVPGAWCTVGPDHREVHGYAGGSAAPPDANGRVQLTGTTRVFIAESPHQSTGEEDYVRIRPAILSALPFGPWAPPSREALLPTVNPVALQPGHPAARRPAAVPWPALPGRKPVWDAWTFPEQTLWGPRPVPARPIPDRPARPWERPAVVTEVVVPPRAEPRFVSRAAVGFHPQRPPQRNEQEQKRLPKRRGIEILVRRALGNITEAMDMVEALWWALPEECRKPGKAHGRWHQTAEQKKYSELRSINRSGKARTDGKPGRYATWFSSPADKAADLASCFQHLDVEQAITNIILMEAQDTVIGSLSPTNRLDWSGRAIGGVLNL